MVSITPEAVIFLASISVDKLGVNPPPSPAPKPAAAAERETSVLKSVIEDVAIGEVKYELVAAVKESTSVCIELVNIFKEDISVDSVR